MGIIGGTCVPYAGSLAAFMASRGKKKVILVGETHGLVGNTVELQTESLGKQMQILNEVFSAASTGVSVYLECDNMTFQFADCAFITKQWIPPNICYLKHYLSRKAADMVKLSDISALNRESPDGYSKRDNDRYVAEILRVCEDYDVVVAVIGIGHFIGLISDARMCAMDLFLANTVPEADMISKVIPAYNDLIGSRDAVDFVRDTIPYVPFCEEARSLGKQLIDEVNELHSRPEMIKKDLALLESIPRPFPVGSCVILHGLIKSPSLNNCNVFVTGPMFIKDGKMRQPVNHLGRALSVELKNMRLC